ncbi:MAG: ATP-grasp domain-containing protein [Dehalobacter sp.]|nr:ATP-grasp domain-containing protein [Dehalobacter sp.]
MQKVLVTDAQMRNSLAIIRSLGKAGLHVTAGEATRFATGAFSKYCRGRIVYPDAKNPDAFADFMLKKVQEEHFDMFIPVTDSTLIPVIQRKKEFARYTTVPFPDYDLMLKALDKSQTLKIAAESGVPCPKTYAIADVGELKDIKDELQYPVIIKPRTSYGSRGVTMCRSAAELVTKYAAVSETYLSPLVQEYIPNGGEVGVYTLYNNDSEPRAVSIQRRLRSYPITGGPSTCRETIEYPGLADTAFRLLKAMKWRGVAMVEFRIDPRDNTPKLMEVNPRFWGSLHLSILSGVDFPYMLYRLAKDGDVSPVMDYRAGVKCRWILPGDILWYLSSPGKIKNLPQFLEITNDDIISLEDPGPTLGFVLAAMRFMFDLNEWKFIIRKPIENR